MKKILLSLIVSVVFALVSTNIISKMTKFNWEMVINFEHIKNSYDVEYAVLIKTLSLTPLNEFQVFINKLDARITMLDSKNPCSQVRSSSTQPNILVSLDVIGQLNIIVRSKDKQLLYKCESYVDEQIKQFVIYRNDYIQKLISEKKFKDGFNKVENDSVYSEPVEEEIKLSEEKDQLEIMLGITVKNIIEGKDKSQLDMFSMKELSQSLSLLSQLASMKNRAKLTQYKEKKQIRQYPYPTRSFNIIQKESRTMVHKKDSSELLGFSIFVILQSIFLIYFFSNSIYAKETKIKKKIYKFFN